MVVEGEAAVRIWSRARLIAVDLVFGVDEPPAAVDVGGEHVVIQCCPFVFGVNPDLVIGGPAPWWVIRAKETRSGWRVEPMRRSMAMRPSMPPVMVTPFPVFSAWVKRSLSVKPRIPHSSMARWRLNMRRGKRVAPGGLMQHGGELAVFAGEHVTRQTGFELDAGSPGSCP